MNISDTFTTQAQSWLDKQPDLSSLRAAVCDFNGCFRGKRLPLAQAGKVLNGALRMPLSLVAQDIWGRDIDPNPMVSNGDADGICQPTGRGPLLMDWLDQPTALLPLWLFNPDGTPCLVDPRQALAAVVARFTAMGLTPVVATELEFYLVDASKAFPEAPISPVTGKALHADGVLSMDDIDHFEPFLADVYLACEAQNIPADAATSEGGLGQFEINIEHVADPLKAADDAMLFKRLVKGVARKHGFAASFMAKPYAKAVGSGLHVHFSLLNTAGENIFDDGTDAGTPVMRHAVAGLMQAMVPSALIFAPHLNSYRRLQPETHAPASVCWAYENRFAAIRIPSGPGIARRIEHRVAGADANPYMVLAAILGAALNGIEAAKEPPAAITGNAYEMDLPGLPTSWGRAIDAFLGQGIFTTEMQMLFAACKRQEYDRFAAQMSAFEIRSYLENV